MLWGVVGKLVSGPVQLALIAAREASLLSLAASVTSTRCLLVVAQLLGANLQRYEAQPAENPLSTVATSMGYSPEEVARLLGEALLERQRATQPSVPAPPEGRLDQPSPVALVGAGVGDGQGQNGQEGPGQ